jgi:hypothetical protein
MPYVTCRSLAGEAPAVPKKRKAARRSSQTPTYLIDAAMLRCCDAALQANGEASDVRARSTKSRDIKVREWMVRVTLA